MSAADISQNTDGGLYHPFQSSHLSHFGDTGLEDSQFGFVIELPHRKRNADLRIITARRTDDTAIRTKQLVQPFFHNGFSVTAGNADNGYLEILTVYFSQFLQGFQGIGDDEEIGFFISLPGKGSPILFGDYKIAHSPVV